MKKLLKKISDYRDKKFKARLERVLNGNVIESNLLIGGCLISGNSVYMLVTKEEMEDILKGKDPHDSLDFDQK